MATCFLCRSLRDTYLGDAQRVSLTYHHSIADRQSLRIDCEPCHASPSNLEAATHRYTHRRLSYPWSIESDKLMQDSIRYHPRNLSFIQIEFTIATRQGKEQKPGLFDNAYSVLSLAPTETGDELDS